MGKSLRRSSTNKIIAGVCGGIGEYFNIDPVIVRVFWLIFIFMPGGPGLLLYLALAFVIPEGDAPIYEDSSNGSRLRNTPVFIGFALIIIGSYMLAKILLPYRILRYLNIFKYWPVLLIGAGIYLISKNIRE